jgi:hypothetical protein
MVDRPSPSLQRIVDDALVAIETIEEDWGVNALKRLITAMAIVEANERREREIARRAIDLLKVSSVEYALMPRKKALMEAYIATHPVEAKDMGLL